MSLVTITLAFIFGIEWGLYQELRSLIIVLIFLSLILLSYFNRFLFKGLIIFSIIIIGGFYSVAKFNSMDTKYSEKNISFNATIISHFSETKSGYSYKYNIKNEFGHKLVLYTKAREENEFEIGTKVHIEGEFSKPDTARNARWI